MFTKATQGSKDATRDAGHRIDSVWLWLGIIILCIVVTFGGHRLVVWIQSALGFQFTGTSAMIDSRMFLILLVLYMVLLAIPFVPGTELGIFLLMYFGANAAIPVYAATVFALLLSFFVGRLVPKTRLILGLRRIGLSRAAEVVASGSDAEANTKLSPLRFKGFVKRLLQFRCVALGILLNTPGNSLIGGGGGIALAAGASRLLTVPQYIVTILIAVAPVPAAVLLVNIYIHH